MKGNAKNFEDSTSYNQNNLAQKKHLLEILEEKNKSEKIKEFKETSEHNHVKIESSIVLEKEELSSPRSKDKPIKVLPSKIEERNEQKIVEQGMIPAHQPRKPIQLWKHPLCSGDHRDQFFYLVKTHSSVISLARALISDIKSLTNDRIPLRLDQIDTQIQLTIEELIEKEAKQEEKELTPYISYIRTILQKIRRQFPEHFEPSILARLNRTMAVNQVKKQRQPFKTVQQNASGCVNTNQPTKFSYVYNLFSSSIKSFFNPEKSATHNEKEKKDEYNLVDQSQSKKQDQINLSQEEQSLLMKDIK